MLNVRKFYRIIIGHAPFSILLLGAFLTILGTFYAQKEVDQRNADRFEIDTAEMTHRIESALTSHVSILRALAGFMGATTQGLPTHKQFRLFTDRLLLDENYPDVQGIGYSHSFSPAAYANAATFATRLGVANFKPWPRDTSEEHSAILYLEPENETNKAALGFDMYSEPVRREAMARARDTGISTVSGKVTLVQEISEEKQSGFLVYTPVYESGIPPDNIEARRRELEGFAYMPFRALDFFNYTLENHVHPHIEVAVYDGQTVAPEYLLYATPGYEGARQSALLQHVSMVDAPNRTWTLVYMAAAEYGALENKRLVPLYLLIGLVSTVGLYFVTRQNIRVQEAVSRKKDEFIHIAGHELRTPVTGIRMYADLLRHHYASSKDRAAHTLLDKMDAQIHTLTQLVADLLDTARIESESLQFQPTRWSMREAIEEAVETARLLAHDHTIEMSLDCDAEVYADKQRILQVLNNLLSNAIKYSPLGTCVQVRMHCAEGTVRVMVQDEGKGIPQDKQKHIFDRYYRVSSDERGPVGLGLGLYISTSIIRRHKGTIGVTSNERTGSTFFFSLPVYTEEV